MEGHLGQSSGASVAGMEPEPSPRPAQATSSGAFDSHGGSRPGRCSVSRVRAPAAGAEQRSARSLGRVSDPRWRPLAE